MTVPQHVGVYGGGRMGAGIAHAFLLAGSSVVIIEADDAAAVAARGRVEAGLSKSAAARGVLYLPVDEVAARLSVSTDQGSLAETDLVIEAVPESLELKQTVLRRIEVVAPRAQIATNTSSLSVDALAAALRHPHNLLGLHFFNPVPASELVEIVVGATTDAALVGAAQQWVTALGKTAITVTDSPGFASSRLGVAIALEAMRMLEDGVASADDIDTAMTLGYKHPTGAPAHDRHRRPRRPSGDRRTSVPGSRHSIQASCDLARQGCGWLPGRKTGQGFFTW